MTRVALIRLSYVRIFVPGSPLAARAVATSLPRWRHSGARIFSSAAHDPAPWLHAAGNSSLALGPTGASATKEVYDLVYEYRFAK